MQVEEYFERSNDLFCITGRDGYFKKVNPAFCRLLGFSEAELYANPVLAFIHPDDVQASRDPANYPGEGKRFENRYRCADGTYKWLSWDAWTENDESSVYGSARDITREKLLERENQRILDSSIDVLCSLSAQGDFISVSKAAETLWGFKPEELLGRPSLQLVYPDDVERTLETVREIKAGKEVTNFNNRFVRRDGSVISLVWSGRWSEPDQMFFLIARDATEKDKQVEELSQNEKMFRALVQSGFDFIAVLDAEARFVYASASHEKLRYSSEFLKGRSPIDFIHPQDQQKVWEAIQSATLVPEMDLPVFRCFDGEGNLHWIKAVATNRLSDPDISGVVISSRDVTESVTAAIEKEQAVKRLRNVFYNLSDGYILLNRDWIIVDSNPSAENMLQTRSSDLLNFDVRDLFSQEKEGTLKSFTEYERAFSENVSVSFEEYLPSINKWFEVAAYPYDDALTIFFKDITEGKLQQLNLELEKEVLEMNSNSALALKDIVDHYLKRHSGIYPEMCCGVNVMDKSGKYLIALSLPGIEAYSENEPIPVSADGGACGAAAFYRDKFIIRDLSADGRSAFYKTQLLEAGFKSCWSYPILDESQNVIATLAVFHTTVKEPSEAEKEIVKRISAFIRILIDSHSTRQRLSISSERYRLATLAAKDAIYDLDILTNELFWGEGFQKVLGYKEDATNLEWWEERIHPADKEAIQTSVAAAIANPNQKYWRGEYRFLKSDNVYTDIIDDAYIIRNERGVAIRMVGAMQDVSETKWHQKQILKQNSLLREIAQINSHQIRKPLANILGLIHAIKESSPNRITDLVELLDKSGKDLDEIIRDIARKTIA